MKEKKDEISLVELYVKVRGITTLLWEKKLWVFLLGVLGASAGLVYATYKPIEHKSKLTFIVDQSSGSGGMSALGGIASSFGLSGFGASQGGLYDNQANLMSYLKSRSLIEEALLNYIPNSKQTFADNFAQAYGWKTEWKETPRLAKINFNTKEERSKFTPQKDSLLYEMYNYILEESLLNVSIPDDEGSIIEMKFQTRDERLSHYFPEVLLDIVSRNYTNAKTKLSRQNVDILQHQTDSVRASLNGALYSSASQSDNVFGLNPALNVERVGATKKQIDVKVSSALLEELIKNLELAKVRLLDETPLIEVIDRPHFPLEQEKTSKFKSILLMGFLSVFIFIIITVSFRFFRKLNEESKNN